MSENIDPSDSEDPVTGLEVPEKDDPLKAFEELVEEYIEDMEIPAPSDAPKVVLSTRAVAEMLNFAQNYFDPHKKPTENHEVMGLLIGWEPKPNELFVYRTYPVTHGSPIMVQFKEEHFKVFEKLNLNETKGEFVLGWYHSHPGLDVFLSAIDINTHASSFQGRNKKAVAIVVDPAKAPSVNDWNKMDQIASAIGIYQVANPATPLTSKYFCLDWRLASNVIT